MKHLTACALLFLSLSATAQKSKKDNGVLVGNAKNVAEMKYEINGKDTLYTIKFRDDSVKDMRAYGFIRFSGKQNFDALYDAISAVNTDPKKYREEALDVNLKGSDNVSIRSYKMMGSTRAIVYTRSAYFYITQKDLDVLFGKRS